MNCPEGIYIIIRGSPSDNARSAESGLFLREETMERTFFIHAK